jgi:hypothetical protein
MGPHAAPLAGAPLEVRAPGGAPVPEFVGFYRWHLPDPVVFERELRVTLQQIGYAVVPAAAAGRSADFERSNPAAGTGWARGRGDVAFHGIAERTDDYCATTYLYCRDAQPVPRLDLAAALADIERRPHESPSPMERLFAEP